MLSLGMFPYVCLATMPLFCEENWPRKLFGIFWNHETNISVSKACIYPPEVNKTKNKDEQLPIKVTWKHRLVVILLLSHCGLQAFLPYSHFITKASIELFQTSILSNNIDCRVIITGRRAYTVTLGI